MNIGGLLFLGVLFTLPCHFFTPFPLLFPSSRYTRMNYMARSALWDYYVLVFISIFGGSFVSLS
jgi:hypothetical protein